MDQWVSSLHTGLLACTDLIRSVCTQTLDTVYEEAKQCCSSVVKRYLSIICCLVITICLPVSMFLISLCAVTEKYYESDSTDASGEDEAPPPPASSTNQVSAATEQPVLSTSSEEKGTKRAAKKGHSTASAKQQKSLTSFFIKN